MRRGLALVPLAAFFLVAVLSYRARGVMESSFSAHPDEPAHVVTGLMARDYLANPKPADPLAYAENYYAHYPKVAIGQWPPVFYGIQAAWTVPLGATRGSLALLMALLTAGVATIVYAVLRPHCGAPVAVLAGLLFLSTSLVQRFGGMVMTEMPLAIFVMGATLSFVRYLETERWSWSALFGAFATLAILTKGNGLMLALVPPLALVLAGGKWHLLRRPATWLPAGIVLLFCAPWYVFTLGLVEGSWAGSVGLDFARKAARTYWTGFFLDNGYAFLVLAGVGIGSRFVRRELRPLWAGLVALAIAAVLFHTIVPASAEYTRPNTPRASTEVS